MIEKGYTKLEVLSKVGINLTLAGHTDKQFTVLLLLLIIVLVLLLIRVNCMGGHVVYNKLWVRFHKI
ncbi:hypothetical protein Hanom_Chr12g01125921 [Helianthus anomalus]